jgi:glycosyltransferase involved in cell wall biosynthesis
LATNYHSFSDAQAQYLDKIIIFSLSQMKQHAPALESKHEFVYLPTDGNFSELQPSRLGNYIFSGGGHSRDYASLIEAVRGLDVHLKIVTFSYKTLGYTRELPENCEVLWTMPLQEFLGIMADALLVVVPLEEGIGPRGHTTAAQALRLGKAVITTENASMEEYITHEQEGLLVRAGDVSGYRQAITRLLEDPQLLARCECNARKRIPGLTYAAFRQHIVVLCLRLLLEDRLVHGCTHNS